MNYDINWYRRNPHPFSALIFTTRGINCNPRHDRHLAPCYYCNEPADHAHHLSTFITYSASYATIDYNSNTNTFHIYLDLDLDLDLKKTP